jgi:hypothetical protein
MSTKALAILIPVLLPALAATSPSVERRGLLSTFSFEPNRGQTDAAVRYLARTPHGVLFFTERQLVIYRPVASGPARDEAVRFELVGANGAAPWEPEGPIGETVSYYVGRDRSKWVNDVPHYGRLVRRGVYPGTDAVYYGSAGRLEYDFVVAPNADPSRIRIRVTGARRIRIGETGDLLVETAQGTIRQHKPALYQRRADGMRVAVEGAFRLSGNNEIGFTVSKHDPRLALSIDPVLESSTYLGGSFEDRVVVADGSVAAGMTTSIDFPGASFGRRKGNDIFVSSNYGSAPAVLIIGGSGDEQATCARIVGQDSVLIGGYTDSKDLPTAVRYYGSTQYQSDPWQAEFAGGATDGFLIRIYRPYSSNYFSRMFVTYVGTSGDDRVTGLDMPTSSSTCAIVGTTTGRELPLPRTAYYQPVQANPAGGVDGFLLLTSLSNSPYVWYTTFLGGSGDDRPLGVAVGYDGYYITGETTSDDFPLVNALFSARAGDSDAFVTEIAADSIPRIASSTLIGGKGADRGVQVQVLDNDDVVVAGVTSSHDLPLKNPLQSSYGGGASDAFLVRFNSDLSKQLQATYYGGSGADEPTSLVMDAFSNLYVGGWTSSANFPVKNAIQSKFGGGADDGFLLEIDPDGGLASATYLGGSGSDRVLGLSAPGDFSVSLSGQTTSANFPLKNATQAALAGASDGFIARVSTPLIGASRVIGGKDVRAWSRITVGRLNGSTTAPVTVTSSDPGTVLVAPNLTDAGRSSMTLPSVAGDAGRYLYVDCLVDHGGADLTISAPGYPSKVTRADCYPVRLSLYFSGSYATSSASGVSTSLWAGPSYVGATLRAVNPDNSLESAYVRPRPGASPLVVKLSNSNPAVGKLSSSSITMSESASNEVVFQPLALGSTTLGAALAKPNASASATVTVRSPLAAGSEMSIPKGFQTTISTGVSGQVPDGVSITLTSQDPSKLVLSRDRTQPGSDKVVLPSGTAGVYGQALASSGDARVTISVPGLTPITETIHLTPPMVFCRDCSTPLELGVKGSTSVSFSIGAAGVDTGRYFLLNPGSSRYRFTAESAAPAVATVTPAAAELTTGSDYANVPFRISGVSEGTTKVTVKPPAGIALSSNFPSSIQVNVKAKAPQMADVEVGKDLMVVNWFVLPYAPSKAVPVTVTTSDPTAVLLSSDGQSAGKATITRTIDTNSSSLGFYVQGLKASGTARITASAPGFGSVTANVALDPSGFAWASDSFSSVLYSYASAVIINAWALDGATMMPVAVQTLRTGVSATVKVANSKPDVVTLDGSYTISSGNTQTEVTLKGKSSGDAVLTLQQPAGFSTPVALQKLKVKIQRPSLTVGNVTIARDTQVAISVTGFPSGLSQKLTVTSGDPSRLLLSLDATKTGSASVTFALSSVPTIYAQALKNQGTVTVTASSSGFNNGVGSVTLVDLGVGMSVNSGYNGGSVQQQDGVWLTTTQSGTTRIVLRLMQVGSGTPQDVGYAARLRPGVNPPQVEVRSSNTKTGVIVNSPVVVTPGSDSVRVQFQPVAAGTAEVSVVQPQGFVAPAGCSSVKFSVTPPGFIGRNILIGRDTFVQMTVGIPDFEITPDTNVTVTLTSPDPSRVLLSRDADSAASASITRTLVAGQRTTDSFYVHALGNSGIVPVKVSAPGWTAANINIALSDTVFSISQAQYSGSPLRAVLQRGEQKLAVVTAVAPRSDLSGYSSYWNPVIRPGAAPITVTVNVSNSSVVAVDNPKVVFAPLSSTVEFAYRPVKTGTATLSLAVPAAYRADPSYSKLTINVEAAKLSFANSLTYLGRNLQNGVLINSEDQFAKGTTLTVSSSDSSRLLVSTDAAVVGKGSVTVTAKPNAMPLVILQSLGDSGTATVTVSASGYQPATLTLRLAPSAAVFSTYSSTFNLKTTSDVQTLEVKLSALDPVTLQPTCCNDGPRAGTDFSVTVRSSDTKVLKVNKSSVQFLSSTLPQIQVQPAGAGTAILSLGVLPGGTAPATYGAILFNITKP